MTTCASRTATATLRNSVKYRDTRMWLEARNSLRPQNPDPIGRSEHLLSETLCSIHMVHPVAVASMRVRLWVKGCGEARLRPIKIEFRSGFGMSDSAALQSKLKTMQMQGDYRLRERRMVISATQSCGVDAIERSCLTVHVHRDHASCDVGAPRKGFNFVVIARALVIDMKDG